jgi:hypothetical protein
MQRTDPYQRRTPCSSSSSSYHEVFARDITFAHARIHGYTVHAHTHTVFPVRLYPTLPCPCHYMYTDRPHPPPPSPASPVTTSHLPRWPACAVPRWPLRMKGKTARDATRRSTTGRRSCTFQQGCEYYFRILQILPCTLPRRAAGSSEKSC